jgi:hypothetical protein
MSPAWGLPVTDNFPRGEPYFTVIDSEFYVFLAEIMAHEYYHGW